MLFGQELENSTRRRSGVVNENIDAPQRRVSILDKILSIDRLGQISWYGDDSAVCLARNLGRRCFQRLLAARADCDIDTLASQGKSDRLADSSARSGDECRLPVHLKIHEVSRRFCVTPSPAAFGEGASRGNGSTSSTRPTPTDTPGLAAIYRPLPAT